MKYEHPDGETVRRGLVSPVPEVKYIFELSPDHVLVKRTATIPR